MLVGRYTSHNCQRACLWNTCLLFLGGSRLCLEEEAIIGTLAPPWINSLGNLLTSQSLSFLTFKVGIWRQLHRAGSCSTNCCYCCFFCLFICVFFNANLTTFFCMVALLTVARDLLDSWWELKQLRPGVRWS